MKNPKLYLGCISLIWIGMILAIGLESFVKFNTPTLSKLVAFDINRNVFNVFNEVQKILLCLLIFISIFTQTTKLAKFYIFVIALLLSIQIVWLFPDLSHHVDLLFSGIKPEDSYKHSLFTGIEILKLAFLIYFSVFTLTEHK